jgi:hypothetical protein
MESVAPRDSRGGCRYMVCANALRCREPRLTGDAVSGILLDNLVRSADSAVDAGSAGLIRKRSYLPSLRSIEFLH